MNQSQRIAALVVRLAGFGLLVVGLMGILYALIVLIRVGDLSVMPAERLWSAVFWVLAGIILISSGRQIGQWLGKGLE
jgi:hypothetical protein